MPRRLAFLMTCVLTLGLALACSDKSDDDGDDDDDNDEGEGVGDWRSGSACEQAAAAAEECTDAAGLSGDTGDPCADDDGMSDAVYACVEAAYRAADCTDQAGLADLALAILTCYGDAFDPSAGGR